jgi:hypothetical protein
VLQKRDDAGLVGAMDEDGAVLVPDRTIDSHRHCHTREGIGHALQAGKQATGSFIQQPSKGTATGILNIAGWCSILFLTQTVVAKQQAKPECALK